MEKQSIIKLSLLAIVIIAVFFVIFLFTSKGIECQKDPIDFAFKKEGIKDYYCSCSTERGEFKLGESILEGVKWIN